MGSAYKWKWNPNKVLNINFKDYVSDSMEFETRIIFSSSAFLSLLVQLDFFWIKGIVIQGPNQYFRGAA